MGCPRKASQAFCARPWATRLRALGRRHRLRLYGLAPHGRAARSRPDRVLELKNLCVWNKTNGGMGTFYRSKHELIFVFKIGSAPHTKHLRTRQHGRYRTNVWDYAGINTMRAGRDEELVMHPTVKPVALVADAIKDCSKRGDMGQRLIRSPRARAARAGMQ